jgi:hypothetical protein
MIIKDATNMKFTVNCQFASKKTAISWSKAGMQKGSNKPWLEQLSDTILTEAKAMSDLFLSKKKLKAIIVIYGQARRIKPLDIHDAAAQIIDEIADILFPRAKGRPIPQTQDRHIWRIEGEKVESVEEKVEIEIGEM